MLEFHSWPLAHQVGLFSTGDKKNVIDCLEDAELSGMITQDPKGI